MEAFSLLKYWRGGGVSVPGLLLAPPSSSTLSTAAAAAVPLTETSDSDDDDDCEGDDGPFFDLEFTVPDEADASEDAQQNPEEEDEEEQECDDGGEGEFKFTLSPSSNDRGGSVSPSGDLFFNGKLVPVESSSSSSESSANKPQFTASLLKSATKFRVFMSGLKKPKPDSASPNPEQSKKQQQRVKFKVEEVPIVSLLTRDHSSRVRQSQNETEELSQPPSSSEEKRFSKEVVMQKYLKMVKPLYVRVSRRYGEKLTAADTAAEGDSAAETVADKGQKQGNLKQGNLPARLRVVCKHLGKSRSASSAVAASPPAAAVSTKRRDDSLLQQQDAIQGAILHCKRSFNASRGCESSQLPRSVSDPLHDVSSELSRKSTTEGKRQAPLKNEET